MNIQTYVLFVRLYPQFCFVSLCILKNNQQLEIPMLLTKRFEKFCVHDIRWHYRHDSHDFCFTTNFKQFSREIILRFGYCWSQIFITCIFTLKSIAFVTAVLSPHRTNHVTDLPEIRKFIEASHTIIWIIRNSERHITEPPLLRQWNALSMHISND